MSEQAITRRHWLLGAGSAWAAEAAHVHDEIRAMAAAAPLDDISVTTFR